jgi:pimeloyl-ACP methyl ester carboxylesterase
MNFFVFDRVVFCFLLLAVAGWTVGDAASFGQIPDFSNPPDVKRPREKTPARPKTTRQTPTARPSSAKKSKFPAPEMVELETKDGITLTCTWFAPEGAESPAKPGAKATTVAAQVVPKGKTTSPFILLHDWDRSREDLLNLGRYLQVAGHAAIVPDLRGHGDSLKVEGSNKPIDRARIRKKDLPSVLADVEACKKFLIRKNDAGVVNIDLLNVAAVGQTAILAMQWAVSDWSWAPVGSIKQGQDVKSLLLIAPSEKFKGISIKPMLKHPLFVGGAADPLPLLVLYSESHAQSAEDASKIYAGIAKGRERYAKAWRERAAEEKKRATEKAKLRENQAEDSEQADHDEELESSPPPAIDPMETLADAPVPGKNTSGSRLIASRESVAVFRYIDRFVKRSVLSRQAAYPWQKRLDQ